MLLTQRLSKLSIVALLSASSLFGASDSEVRNYLKNAIGANPAISNIEVEINSKKRVPNSPWSAYFISIDGEAKQNGVVRRFSQGSVYFANDDLITPELYNIKTGERYNDSLTPDFSPNFYKKHNLISGNEKSTHKIAIFSDPLCPFCRKYVPEAINYMKKYPKTFALYYYNLPLEGLHPASVTLVKAEIAAAMAGVSDAALKLYRVEVDPKESDEQKILDAFNRAVGSKVTLADIRKPQTLERYDSDRIVAKNMVISGTPTIYVDGIKDNSKNRYKEIKVK